MWLATIPHVFIWLYFVIRSRAFLWMSAANPGIITGGLLGEPKHLIQDLMPDELLPNTIYIESGELSVQEVKQKIKAAGLTFPIIAKPNRGERGKKVAKLNDEQELQAYVAAMQVDYLLQEYIDLALEGAVMAYVTPDDSEQGIISICVKEFLTIEGDGRSTVLELMQANIRAYLILDKLKDRYANKLDEVLAEGEKMELEPIANHSRGTAFLSGMQHLTPEMEKTYAALTRKTEGVYFARYDIRYASIADLQAGRVKIMELNGVGADPAHIYDPDIPFFKKYRIVYQQWKIMFKIARQNHRKGVPYMTLKEWRTHRKALKKYNEKLLSS